MRSNSGSPTLPTPSTLARSVWNGLVAVDRFVRLHFLGFSAMLVLLGAAAAEPTPSTGQWLLLVAGALCFHNFAYVFNDYIDLPVDRTQPLRQDDFLVKGTIRPWQALTFALLQIPLALAITVALGGGWQAIVSILVGFAFMTIYDVWGKRCPVPPLTDLAQGLGWGSLAIWGAWALGEPPAPLTWVAFAYGAGFIFLINGVHGGLRDLANDFAGGRITTAIFFGARPGAAGVPVGLGLRAFALGAQGFLIAATVVPLVRNDFGYTRSTWWVTATIVAVLNIACLHYTLLVLRPGSATWQRDFRVHLFLLLFALVVLFVPFLQSPLLEVLLVLFFWPLIFHDTTYEVAGAWLRRIFPGAKEAVAP